MEQLPFSNKPERFTCSVQNKQYEFTTKYNTFSKLWEFDLKDAVTQKMMISGMPIVGGVDLLGQFEFMKFGFVMACLTDGTKDFYEPPTLENLGLTSFVYALGDSENV